MNESSESPANPALPVVIGLLLPWLLFLAAFAPRAWWGVSAGLLVLLGALLILAAHWAYREAQRRDLDPAWWAALTVITLGTALILLAGRRTTRMSGSLQFICSGCGRLGELAEPFCYGCGRLGELAEPFCYGCGELA